MAPETLIFMPNGDVTLTLIRNVVEEFHPPPCNPALEKKPINERLEPTPEPEAEAPEEAEEDVMFFAPDPPDSENIFPPPRRARRGSDASSRRDRSTSPPGSFWASLKRQAARVGDPIVDEPLATPAKPVKKPERIVVSSHEVHCVVSSRHMMLASQYFEKLLSGNSGEATTLRGNRQASISLSADLDAMIILLNIVHGVSRKVPRQVGLEALGKLAVLVSNFGMLDAVQFFSDTWIDNLQTEGLPESYNESVLPLLFIFWVFDRPSEFKDMTRLVQWECDEKLGDNVPEVPIPQSIIDAIKRDRELAIESAITIIHTLINKYLDGQTICNGTSDEELRYACDATVLGSLMKSSRKIGIWPKPEAPFIGRKFKILTRAMRSIRILDVCKKTSSRRLHLLGPSSNSHGLEDSIEAAMKSIEASIDGLELSDYAKKSDEYTSEFPIVFPVLTYIELGGPTIEDSDKDIPLENIEKVIEKMKDEVKVSQGEKSIPEAKPSTGVSAKKTDVPTEQQDKIPTTQYSSDVHQQGVPISARVSVNEEKTTTKEEVKPNPRISPNLEGKTPPKIIAKVVEEPSKEDVRILVDRKLNRPTSFPMIPKEEIKSPVKEPHVIPRVASVEEETVKKVPQRDKEEVKSTTVEVKASLSDALTTTEDEEAVILPQNFKVRKQKKRFSAKY